MVVNAEVVIVPLVPNIVKPFEVVPSKYFNNERCPATTFVTVTGTVVTPVWIDPDANAHIVLDPETLATGNS